MINNTFHIPLNILADRSYWFVLQGVTNFNDFTRTWRKSLLFFLPHFPFKIKGTCLLCHNSEIMAVSFSHPDQYLQPGRSASLLFKLENNNRVVLHIRSESSQSLTGLNVTEKLNTCKVAVQTIQTSHFQECWPVHHSSPVCWLCGGAVKGSWSRLNTVGILVCLFGNKFACTFEWTFSSLDQTTKCTCAGYMTEECAGAVSWLVVIWKVQIILG